MNLDHVGNGFAGSQHIIHAVSALRTAVADVRRVIFCRLSALFIHAVHRLLHHLIQVKASGMRIAVNTFNHNLRLFDVLVIPARAHIQCIKLSPKFPFLRAFLLHVILLLWSFLSIVIARIAFGISAALADFLAEIAA